MSGHTPGPWIVENSADMLWVGPRRSDCDKVDDVVVGLSYDRELTHAAKVRQQANARLIAAALDLLAALQTLVDNHDAGRPVLTDIAHARAAIARATGDA